MFKFLAKKYNSKDIKLVSHINEDKAGFVNGVKFDTKNNILSIELKENQYYLLEDSLKRFTRIVYRNGSLFTQTLKGSKSNFFNITKKQAIALLSSYSISKKEIISLGISWDVK